MTLLLTAFAAVISSAVWYVSEKRRERMLGTLSLMYWGATIMWFADAVFEYAALGSEAFTPSFEEMLNDSFLGLSVIVLGLIIWLVILLIRDPEGVVKAALAKKD